MKVNPSSSSIHAAEDGRFAPGTLLVERYRIISLLGRGGMGEVYRASDVKLSQPVALKFLPASVARKPGLLERFHGEVRIARQVSHPNICRVYDIGEAEGHAFISMEYVDGEDLGSLLRRIGRLPSDKAIEIARKLCAGLAAAHAKGVLHRDLKPGNIMIDGRGQVLIMDFGLAAVADSVSGAEVRNGTPAYMAPEQLAGKEVSERSDIYALGLVLYEIFTGQRAFKTANRFEIPSAVSVVRDVDPLVERVISRCLDPDPAKRPQTALGVARMLPGGDPLAEALAAGDTPSPEVVANSGSTDGLRVPVAIGCLVAAVAGIIAASVISQRTLLVNRLPMEFSPEVMSAKAREIADGLGYADRPVDRAFGWVQDRAYGPFMNKQPDAAQRRAQLGKNRPAVLYFWYREAPRYLVPRGGGTVVLDDPPAAERGNLQMLLDSEGRLLQFQAWPDERATAFRPAAQDFGNVLAAARFNPSQMTSVESSWTPPSAFDTRAAWTLREGPDAVRVEVAAWRGRVISLERLLPWNVSLVSAQNTSVQSTPFFVLVQLLLPLIAAFVAWRNLKLGRGDMRGATRVAVFTGVLALVDLLGNVHHVPSANEISVVFYALRDTFWTPALVWIIYVAFEPFLRRIAPHTLIGWSRVLEGRWRDPLVGGHLLIGVVVGLVLSTLLSLNGSGSGGILLPVDSLQSAGWLASVAGTGCYASLVLTLLWLLFRIATRRTWLASTLMVLTFAAALTAPRISAAAFVANAMIGSVIALVIVRLGVLALAVQVSTQWIVVTSGSPLTTNLSVWYAHNALLAVAALLALAIYGFRTTLAGRPLWRSDLQVGSIK